MKGPENSHSATLRPSDQQSKRHDSLSSARHSNSRAAPVSRLRCQAFVPRGGRSRLTICATLSSELQKLDTVLPPALSEPRTSRGALRNMQDVASLENITAPLPGTQQKPGAHRCKEEGSGGSFTDSSSSN
ncbi:hypothetical protein COCON_G00162660 [Conger conger]|uniref:Uncharacterized protein n=1 Tax=Conger conger TaxID=82655 RepID=A0A9Q1D6A0_CONCO|nr:hypothetical protein COCON_G00162660 [Conger conger]